MGLSVPRVCLYMFVLGLWHISCDGSKKNEQHPAQKSDGETSGGPGSGSESVVIVQSEIIPHESLLVATGSQLYKIHCELCHGSLADLANNANDPMTAPLVGKNSLAIKAAIESIPEMRSLLDKELSDNALDLIAAELNVIPTASRPDEIEPVAISVVGEDYQPAMLPGPQMYKKYCGDASCHGPAETNSIDAKTFAAYIGALNSVPVMKNRAELQGLTRSHLEEILKSL